MAKTLDSLAVGYLLDNNQKALKTLLEVNKIALALVCPLCGNEDRDTIVTNGEGDEAFCEACDEYYGPGEKAADLAAEKLGVYVEFSYRR